MKVIVYTDKMMFINGMYTWVMNFCRELKDIYDITVISRKFSPSILNDVNTYVKAELWSEAKTYECDVCIFNFDFSYNPDNIIYKKNYTILHCDYSKVKGHVTINPNTNYIAVSKYAADAFTKVYGVACDTVESIIPRIATRRVLKLVSCTRMVTHKGAERIFQLAKLLDKYCIKYIWLNFSDKDIMNIEFIKTHNNPKVIQMLPVSNIELRDYIKDADYLVQLSDHEGYCFAIHEALSLQTPVITTDIPIFEELIIDGVNGYKVPLDMQDIDIEKIASEIPTNFKPYTQNIDSIKSKWGELLNVNS